MIAQSDVVSTLKFTFGGAFTLILIVVSVPPLQFLVSVTVYVVSPNFPDLKIWKGVAEVEVGVASPKSHNLEYELFGSLK